LCVRTAFDEHARCMACRAGCMLRLLLPTAAPRASHRRPLEDISADAVGTRGSANVCMGRLPYGPPSMAYGWKKPTIILLCCSLTFQNIHLRHTACANSHSPAVRPVGDSPCEEQHSDDAECGAADEVTRVPYVAEKPKRRQEHLHSSRTPACR